MQKMSLSTAVAAVMLAGGGQVWAANVNYGAPSPVSVPGIAAGQPAKASDVTGAFGAVQNAVNDNFALIQANTDNINTLQQQVNNLPTGTCPGDMVDVGQFCIDTYEASVSGGNTVLVAAGCAADGAGCAAAGLTVASVAGATPQQKVSWFQALQLCKLAGKRLPSNAEWQLAATGTDVNAGSGTAGTAGPGCNSSGGLFGPTGADFDGDPATNCRSDAGAFDMVGNVREWVSDYTSNTTATDMRVINAVTRGGGPGGGVGEYTIAEQAANDNSADVFGFRCAKDK